MQNLECKTVVHTGTYYVLSGNDYSNGIFTVTNISQEESEFLGKNNEACFCNGLMVPAATYCRRNRLNKVERMMLKLEYGFNITE